MQQITLEKFTNIAPLNRVSKPCFSYTRTFLNETSNIYRERLESMILVSIKEFPELEPSAFRIGLANTATARANTFFYSCPTQEISLSFNPIPKLTYNTIGHELTHFVQQLKIIPHGEKSCDLYTLARSELFLDEPPHYLMIPEWIKNNWERYANAVQECCLLAIEKRETITQYIKWCENEIENGIVG